MDQAWLDVRYALRTLRRDLGFTALIVLILAIGIGLNTAVFSVVRAVLLAPLPYEDPARLAMLWTAIPDEGVHEASSAYANVQDWKERSRVFEDLATFDPTSLTLTDGAWPEQISGARVSANLVSVLGVAPALGRAISPEDERRRAAVVVLGHALWERRFEGAPDAIGRTLEIGGVPFQVTGVMPDGFGFPDDTQLWLPQTTLADWDANAAQRGTGLWRVIARVRRDASMEQVRADMNAIAAGLEQAYPDANAGLGINVIPLHDQMTGASFRLALWMLFGAVGLVLLIACANGAHMILVRGMNRTQELALRVSLGADTPRLIRQLLTESLVLAAAAGVAGVLLARAGLRLLIAFAPDNIPRLDEIGIDATVLAYATAVSLAVGVLFGIAPALGFVRAPVARVLREGRAPANRGAGGVRRALIVVQFALAIVLVFGASVLIRSLIEVQRVDPGFRSESVVMAQLSVEAPSRRRPFYEQVVAEVRSIPGVAAAGIVEEVFIGGAPTAPIMVEGSASVEPTFAPMRFDAIAGDFFATLGVPLREGRVLTASDGAESVPVAVVNETMARRFWPGQSAVGKRFRAGAADAGAPWLEVVGVVGDMRRQGLEQTPIAQVFRPYAQEPSRNMVLLIRAEPGAPDLIASVRTRIAAIDGTVPLYGITTLAQAMDRYLVQRRFQTLLLGLFSAIALTLAAVGVYGLIQYSVMQRTREIGVRVALGGTSGHVLSMVLRQGLTVALQGLAVGIVVALLLSERLSALFFGVAAADLGSIVVTSGVLLLATLVACWLPARRAARVDPMTALRHW
jgi:predicted permease